MNNVMNPIVENVTDPLYIFFIVLSGMVSLIILYSMIKKNASDKMNGIRIMPVTILDEIEYSSVNLIILSSEVEPNAKKINKPVIIVALIENNVFGPKIRSFIQSDTI